MAARPLVAGDSVTLKEYGTEDRMEVLEVWVSVPLVLVYHRVNGLKSWEAPEALELACVCCGEVAVDVQPPPAWTSCGRCCLMCGCPLTCCPHGAK